MDTHVLVSREVSKGSEGKNVLDPSPPSPPSRDSPLSPWTPMSGFRAKLAKAAKERMSSILRSFASFARQLIITMDTYVRVSREVSKGSEGKNVLDPSLLRLLCATAPYHHGHLCPGFARS